MTSVGSTTSAPRGAAADLPAPEPPRDPESIKELAGRVLADSDFDEPSPSLLERIFDWIGGLFPDIDVGGGGGGSGGSSILGWLILSGIAVVVVWLVVRAIENWAPRGRRRDRDLDISVDRPADVDALRRRAELFESEGRWRAAVRAWYRVLVAELLAGAVIDDVPGWTPREVTAAVAARTEAPTNDGVGLVDCVDGVGLVDCVDGAGRVLEEVWYAGRPATADDAAAVRAAAARVREREGVAT